MAPQPLHPGRAASPGAAERQARLLRLSTEQRERVAESWRQLTPAFESVDATFTRIDGMRRRLAGLYRHPLAKPLGALGIAALVAGVGAGRLLGGARRLAGGAARAAGGLATLASLWNASRRLSGAASTRAR